MIFEEIFEWVAMITVFTCIGLAVFVGVGPNHKLSQGLNRFVHSRGMRIVGKWIGYALLGFIGVLLLAVALVFFGPEKEKLAEQYHISQDKVIIDPKPHGCDFDDAPLGNKHCHFEKHVNVDRACPNCKVTSVYVPWERVEE